MFEKNRSIITKVLILIIIVLSLILVMKYIVPFASNYIDLNVKNKVPKMFFLTNVEELYGVVDNKGRTVLDIRYEQIARNGDTLYLKTDKNSYFYFLKTKSSIMLGGRETNVSFAYDKNNRLLPYFIARYGERPSDYIYRIYTLEGKRYIENDFATLAEAKDAVDAKDGIIPSEFLKKYKDKYENIKLINHLSKNGEAQFIANKKGVDDKKFGIVSESGKIILDFKMNSIEMLDNCYNALIMEDDYNKYIYNSDEKLINVDRNFDYFVNEYYIIQKKGDNITKIFDINGNVIINELFNLKEDIRFITNLDNYPFVVVKNISHNVDMYDMKEKKKLNVRFGVLNFDEINFRNLNTVKNSLIYLKNGRTYALDVNTFNEFELSDNFSNYMSLDYGILYK